MPSITRPPIDVAVAKPSQGPRFVTPCHTRLQRHALPLHATSSRDSWTQSVCRPAVLAAIASTPPCKQSEGAGSIPGHSRGWGASEGYILLFKLKHPWRTLKVTSLKWFLGASWSCTTIASASFQNVFIIPKGKRAPISSRSPFPPPPSSRQPLPTCHL